MIEDYFGARMDAAKERNWDYIGKMNERNREMQREVLDGRKDAADQKCRYMGRKWNNDDRAIALKMHKQGYRVGDIAEYLARTEERVFDELQDLIAKDALGVAAIGKYTTNYRAQPKFNLSPIMDKRPATDWMRILNIALPMVRRLEGTRKIKDVPAAVAIKLAISIREPVDTLFDFFVQKK